MLFVMGPFIYLDITFTFLFILIPALSPNNTDFLSLAQKLQEVRTNQLRHMSPFILNLYLKPLYSIRGGSTTLDEPFIKKPSDVDFRLNPLYK